MNGHGLNGAAVLITGAASGLGEATARAFAEAGAVVACLDRDGEGACRVSESLGGLGSPSFGLQVDVADADAVFGAVNEVARRCGRIDVAVNSAAVDYVTPAADMSVEQWDRVIAVNLRAPFLVSKAVWPHMAQQRSGHIVNIASTAAERAWGNASAYHASKWGVRGFSRGLGVEGRERGIRVTTVIPGGMRTHFFDRFPEQGIPMPDMSTLQDPATVAQAIVFAVCTPPESALQEFILTPVGETSWP